MRARRHISALKHIRYFLIEIFISFKRHFSRRAYIYYISYKLHTCRRSDSYSIRACNISSAPQTPEPRQFIAMSLMMLRHYLAISALSSAYTLSGAPRRAVIYAYCIIEAVHDKPSCHSCRQRRHRHLLQLSPRATRRCQRRDANAFRQLHARAAAAARAPRQKMKPPPYEKLAMMAAAMSFSP